MFQKISQAIYGPPKKESADCGLEKDQISLVNKIIEKCVKHSVSKEYVDIACIFVSIFMSNEIQTTVPLFRVRSVDIEKAEEIPNCKFIDHIGRVYDSFEKYKTDNTWDRAYLCLPYDGYYSLDRYTRGYTIFAVDKQGQIHDTVESDPSRTIVDQFGKVHTEYSKEEGIVFLNQLKKGKYIQFADTTSTVTGLGSSAGMLVGLGMSLFPPTAPIGIATMTYSGIAGAPGAVYATVKSIGTLVDRAKHEQSINITDSEARSCWLTTAVSAVSVGTIASTRYLLYASKGGNLVSGWVRAGVTGMMATGMTLSGVNVANMIYNLYEKRQMGEEITRLDIFQLSTSIFFFTHSAVNFQTANTIIKDLHKQEADTVRMGLNKREQKRFDAMMKAHKETVQPGQVRELEGQASFVREMYRIDNVKEFYKQFRFTPDKQFRINNEYTMSPRKFVTLTDEQRTTIMTNSQKLRSGEITFDQFRQNTKIIRTEVRINSDRETINAADNLKNRYDIDVKKFKINGKNHKLKPHDIHEISRILKTSDPEVHQFARDFAEKTNPKNPNEYINAMKYAGRNVEDIVAAKVSDTNQPKDVLRPNVVKDLRATNELDLSFKKLIDDYETSNTDIKFRNSNSAANHFEKHAQEFVNSKSSNSIKMDKYMEIADELMKENPTEKHWTADGNGVNCTYTGKDGEYCITYTPISEGTLGDEVIVSLYRDNRCLNSYIVKDM